MDLPKPPSIDIHHPFPHEHLVEVLDHLTRQVATNHWLWDLRELAIQVQGKVFDEDGSCS